MNNVLLRMGRDAVEAPEADVPQIYDIRTDEMRPITQDEVDALLRDRLKLASLLRFVRELDLA